MRSSDVIKYCNLMEEIKKRTLVINDLLPSPTNTLNKEATIESIYLQFRKSLELIALGSLVANREAFSQVYDYFSKCWNAELILNDIARVNPEFYPKPLLEELGRIHIDDIDLIEKNPDKYLTKKDFLKLYKKCGAIMHAGNPYGSQVDYNYYEGNITKWLSKIIELLQTHQIKLINDESVYFIRMNNKDRKVDHYEIFY